MHTDKVLDGRSFPRDDYNKKTYFEIKDALKKCKIGFKLKRGERVIKIKDPDSKKKKLHNETYFYLLISPEHFKLCRRISRKSNVKVKVISNGNGDNFTKIYSNELDSLSSAVENIVFNLNNKNN